MVKVRYVSMRFDLNFDLIKTKKILQELLLGENGWLTRRLNYMKLCKKKLAAGAVNVSINNPIEEPLSNPECDLEWLKTNSIDKNDREGIVKKLNSTRELRKEMLKITETDLREQFSFFLVAPELVSIYHIQFKICNLNSS